jgi:Tfp pilus assembly protein PilF
VIRQALIIIDLAWLRSLTDEDVAIKQQRLQHAIDLDANHPMLQKVLVRMVLDEATEANRAMQEMAKKVLNNARASGTLAGTALSLLGTEAASLGKFKTAEKQFRDSMASGDNSVLVLNNLAWVLVQQSDPALTQEALGYINQALQKQPTLSELWKTRAEIWEQQGQILEAIADLEKSIQLGDKSSAVRLKLAELYTLRGDTETADRYQRQVANEVTERPANATP